MPAIMLVTALLWAAYVLVYVGLLVAKPSCLTTNDGPVAAFRIAYLPLRYAHADKPSCYAASLGGWRCIAVRDASYNAGNGYLDFTWRGQHWRAYGNRPPTSYDGGVLRLRVRYELITTDAYDSRLVPCVQTAEPTADKEALK